MLVGLVTGILILVGVLVVAYSNRVFHHWSHAKDRHDRAVERAHDVTELSDRAVKNATDVSNDVLFGHAGDFRDEVRTFDTDHARALSDVQQVMDESIPAHTSNMVRDLGQIERQVLDGSHVIRRMERERDVVWPAHVASYTDSYGTLDDLRTTGLRIADNRVMTATDFRTHTDMSLVNLRSSLVQNIAQYEIDEVETRQNEARLHAIDTSLNDVIGGFRVRSDLLSVQYESVVSALSTQIVDSLTLNIDPKIANIESAQLSLATSFVSNSTYLLTTQASVAMNAARRATSGNYDTVFNDLSGLVEQRNFNAEIMEIERQAESLRARLLSVASSVRSSTSVAGASTVTEYSRIAQESRDILRTIEEEHTTKQSHLLLRSGVVPYLTERSDTLNLFDADRPNEDLYVGELLLSDHGRVQAPSTFAEKHQFLLNTGIHPNLTLDVHNDRPVRFGGNVKIGASTSVGHGLIVGGEGVPVVFETDPWIDGMNETLLQAARNLGSVAHTSMTKQAVSLELAKRALKHHEHTNLLRHDSLIPSLAQSVTVNAYSNIGPGSMSTDAIGSMDLACLSDSARTAAGNAAVRPGSNIEVKHDTFSRNATGAIDPPFSSIPLSNFEDKALNAWVTPNTLTASVARASWIDFSTCPNGYFTNVSYNNTGRSPVSAAVAYVTDTSTIPRIMFNGDSYTPFTS